MISTYTPSTILKGTLNFLQFCVNQMSVFITLWKISILLRAIKNINNLQKNFGILCEGEKKLKSKKFLLYHINLRH